MKKAKTILIAGPYRSGTGNNPQKMEENLRRLEDAGLIIFRAGHIPLIGEWLGLPLQRMSNLKKKNARSDEDVMYAVAARIISNCDAVLRLPGESSGADQDVNVARRKRIPVYYSIEELLKHID